MIVKKDKNKQELNFSFKIFIAILIGLVILVIFSFIMAHQLKHGDFPPHIAWAKEFSINGYLYKIPHPLFAKLVTIVRALLPANVLVWISPFAKQVYDLKAFELSALIVTTLSYLALGWTLFFRILKEWDIQSKVGMIFACIVVCVLLLFAPIFIFTYPDQMFRGYLSANRYDSPTFILAKPFIVWVFFGILDNIFNKWSWREAILMVFVMMCGTLAKPSFTITILPTLGLFVLIEIRKLKKINWLFLLFPIGLTAIIVLFGQYAINYTGDRGDRIIFAPFEDVLYYAPNIPYTFFFVFVSILFPLSVTVFNWNQVKELLGFKLGWINLAVGLVMYYLLAEEINMGLSNFLNGPMLGNFILFIVTALWWGKDLYQTCQNEIKMNWKQIITSGLLIVHFVCGIIYYFAILNNTLVNVN